ncbi:MAG: hypothetical protein R3A46_18060 [Thermomicrobiales bacterium]
MTTVIVSFRFLAPHRPDEKVVKAHHSLLCRLDGVSHYMALDRETEHAYVLTFESEAEVEKYLASEEHRRYSTEPGCYDVFVTQFEPLPIPFPEDDGLFEDLPPEALRSAALSV